MVPIAEVDNVANKHLKNVPTEKISESSIFPTLVAGRKKFLYGSVEIKGLMVHPNNLLPDWKRMPQNQCNYLFYCNCWTIRRCFLCSLFAGKVRKKESHRVKFIFIVKSISHTNT